MKNIGFHTKKSFFWSAKFQILILLLFVQISYSQISELGTPHIRNYPPKEYGYESQNFSILTDDKGLLYVGNLNGILTFDGTNWQLIDAQGGPMLTKSDKGDIYALSVKRFYHLINKHRNGILVDELSESKQFKTFIENNNILQIEAIGNDLLINTFYKLYLWDGNKFTLIDYNSKGYRIFKAPKGIYIYKYPGELLYLTKNGLTKFNTNVQIPEDKDIEFILYYDSTHVLLKPTEDNIYLISKDSTNLFDTNIKHYINALEINVAKNLHDKILLGSQRCGLVVLDKKTGNYICNISKSSGLIGDLVNDIFVDSLTNTVWLAMGNGISRLDVPSAFTYMKESSGIRGLVIDIIRYNNSVFVGTNQGVFVNRRANVYDMNHSCYSNIKFQQLNSFNKIVKKFFIHNDSLYICAKDGIYRLNKDYTTTPMLNGYYFQAVQKSKLDSNRLLISIDGGLITARITPDSIIPDNIIDTLPVFIRTIAEDNKKHIVWGGTDNNGLVYFNFKNSYINKPIVSYIPQGQGLPDNFDWIDVYTTKRGVLFSTFKGVYRLDSKNMTFYKDTLFNPDNSNRWFYPIEEDSLGNIWYSSGKLKVFKKQTGVKKYLGNNRYNDIHTPFNLISDLIIERIFPDKDSVVWLSTYDELIRIDLKKLKTKAPPPKIFFKEILFGKDSVEFRLFDSDSINYDLSYYHKLKYSLNNIKFSFTAIDYLSDKDILFSWKLEGYDKEWSPWSKEHFKEYTNLWEKEYTFKVRAKGIFGNISPVISYTFKIKPPVYRMWYAYILYLVLLGSFIVMIMRYRSFLYAKEKHELERQIAEKTEEVVRQKEKAEMLIKKLLPEDTAKEIQMAGKAKRKKYEMVTVLFADIKGFTKIAEHMQSEMLLDELDRIFLTFDELIENKQIEKIKTIGDAYMCAGGIPRKNRTNAVDVILVAFEMLRYVEKLRNEAINDWQIRIGVHTGPVIAGVVGSKKLTYDIWGDTVNIASRMESSGKEGQINITEATYIYIEDFFECEYRGKIPVKYKGELDMYFVKGIKPEFSVDGKGIEPNEKFRLRYLQLKFRELEDVVYYRLENGLNKDIKYHDLKHTIDVVNQVEIIAKGEGVTEEEMLLLKTAALFHDFGFVLGYSDHEESSVKLAKEMLPNYGYSKEQIQTICELIYATKFPPKPENKLQKIICDADLDYLGRPDFLPVSIRLYEELFKFKQVKNLKEWNKIQVGFLENHQYFTETARKMREVNKNKQLEAIKKWIAENS